METITANLSPATPEMCEWMEKGTDNYFDPEVLQYPTTKLIAAKSKSKTIMYMPFQMAAVLESLAINPNATKHEIAVALRTIITSLSLLLQTNGVGEMYFLGSNKDTNEFAMKQDIFTQSKFPLFRAKTLI